MLLQPRGFDGVIHAPIFGHLRRLNNVGGAGEGSEPRSHRGTKTTVLLASLRGWFEDCQGSPGSLGRQPGLLACASRGLLRQ